MRLIDAEALENEIVKTMRYVPKDAVLDVACMVNRAPTIEAKPVVHAHWEWTGVLEEKMFICSHCRECAHYDGTTWWTDPFCWNCGAQMGLVSNTNKLNSSENSNSSVKIPVISMEDVPKIMEEMEK